MYVLTSLGKGHIFSVDADRINVYLHVFLFLCFFVYLSVIQIWGNVWWTLTAFYLCHCCLDFCCEGDSSVIILSWCTSRKDRPKWHICLHTLLYIQAGTLELAVQPLISALTWRSTSHSHTYILTYTHIFQTLHTEWAYSSCSLKTHFNG